MCKKQDFIRSILSSWPKNLPFLKGKMATFQKGFPN